MSIIVFYQYDCWGGNGRYTEERIDEFESEREAIIELGSTTWFNAIDEVIAITRVVGGEEGANGRIFQGVDLYVAKMRHEEEISKLRNDLRNAQRFLQNNEEEVLRKQATVNRCLVRLAELGVE